MKPKSKKIPPHKHTKDIIDLDALNDEENGVSSLSTNSPVPEAKDPQNFFDESLADVTSLRMSLTLKQLPQLFTPARNARRPRNQQGESSRKPSHVQQPRINKRVSNVDTQASVASANAKLNDAIEKTLRSIAEARRLLLDLEVEDALNKLVTEAMEIKQSLAPFPDLERIFDEIINTANSNKTPSSNSAIKSLRTSLKY